MSLAARAVHPAPIQQPKRSRLVGGRQGRQPRNRTVVDGIEFASATEARFYGLLLQLRRAGIVTAIEAHPAYIIQQKFRNTRGILRRQRKYTADFRVTLADGSERVFEVKGSPRVIYPEFKLRRDAVELQYGIAIYVVYPDGSRWIDHDTKEVLAWS